MSSVKESVGWQFGKVMSYFKFLDFKKNLKTDLSAASKVYTVTVLLTNACTCLYGSQTGSFFNLATALMEHYFEWHDTKKRFLESFLFFAAHFYPRLFFFVLGIFLVRIHSMQGWAASISYGVTRKRSTKRLKLTVELFWKNLQIKGVC